MLVTEAEILFKEINFNSIFKYYGIDHESYPFCIRYFSNQFTFFLYINQGNNRLECYSPDLNDFITSYDVFTLLDPSGDLPKEKIKDFLIDDKEVTISEAISKDLLLRIVYSLYPLDNSEDAQIINNKALRESTFLENSIFKGSTGQYASLLMDGDCYSNIIHFTENDVQLKYDIFNGINIQEKSDSQFYIGVFPNPFGAIKFFNIYKSKEWQVIYASHHCNNNLFRTCDQLMNQRNLPMYLVPSYDRNSLIFSLRYIASYANYYSSFFCDISFSNLWADFTIFYDKEKLSIIRLTKFFTKVAKAYRSNRTIIASSEKKSIFTKYDFSAEHTHPNNGKSSYCIRIALKAENVFLFAWNFLRDFELDGSLDIVMCDKEISRS